MSLLAFGSYQSICENVARAACTLWSRGSLLGGALVSDGALVVSRLRDYCMAFLGFCYFALVFFCHTNPWGDTVISSFLVRFRCLWTVQLITGRAGFWYAFWVFLCVLFGFGFLLFAFLFSTVTAQWIMYRSNSVLFCMYIVIMTDVATALIRWICKMQLFFRLDKRPGENHLALDGKKKRPSRSAPRYFILISMVSRYWSSRLALRSVSIFVSSCDFFVLLQFPLQFP